MLKKILINIALFLTILVVIGLVVSKHCEKHQLKNLTQYKEALENAQAESEHRGMIIGGEKMLSVLLQKDKITRDEYRQLYRSMEDWK